MSSPELPTPEQKPPTEIPDGQFVMQGAVQGGRIVLQGQFNPLERPKPISNGGTTTISARNKPATNEFNDNFGNKNRPPTWVAPKIRSRGRPGIFSEGGDEQAAPEILVPEGPVALSGLIDHMSERRFHKRLDQLKREREIALFVGKSVIDDKNFSDHTQSLRPVTRRERRIAKRLWKLERKRRNEVALASHLSERNYAETNDGSSAISESHTPSTHHEHKGHEKNVKRYELARKLVEKNDVKFKKILGSPAQEAQELIQQRQKRHEKALVRLGKKRSRKEKLSSAKSGLTEKASAAQERALAAGRFAGGLAVEGSKLAAKGTVKAAIHLYEHDRYVGRKMAEAAPHVVEGVKTGGTFTRKRLQGGGWAELVEITGPVKAEVATPPSPVAPTRPYDYEEAGIFDGADDSQRQTPQQKAKIRARLRKLARKTRK